MNERGGSDLDGGVRRERAAKNRQAAQHKLFVGRQQSPRMIENGAHGAMPFGDIALAAGKKIKIAFNFRGDGLERQGAYPRRGQFDSQWHAFNKAANTRNFRKVRLWRKLMPHLLGAGDKEFNRVSSRRAL